MLSAAVSMMLLRSAPSANALQFDDVQPPLPSFCCPLCCHCSRVAWCHGAAGYVLTMLKAAEVLGDPGGRYSTAAAAAGEDIWRRGLLRKVRREAGGCWPAVRIAFSAVHWYSSWLVTNSSCACLP
jgi:hypothetical protein